MPRRRPTKNAHGAIRRLSQRQAENLAERQARAMLCVSRDEAFAMLDRGELRGTIAEAELSILRALIQG